MAATVAVVVLGLALVALVGFPIYGLLTYSEEKAAAIRRAEAHAQDVAAQVPYLRERHPEIVKRDRLDRNDFYVFVQAAMFVYGWVVLFVDVPYGNLGAGALGTQHSLGGSLVGGSAMCLVGSLLGTHVGGLCIGGPVCRNVWSVLLGDDVRVPYVLAWCGLTSSAGAMVLYGYTVAASAGPMRLATTFGGLLCIGIGLACLTSVPKFFRAGRRYIAERAVFEAEARAREDDL